MNIFGIIAEYNPFHNGHYLQINKAREMGATHIVACMSGNFVQRGDVAAFSKWSRAKAALLNGVDLVIEMPTPYAISPAKDFAFAGVFLLDKLGVNTLCFGSECGDEELLKKAAKCVELAEENDLMNTYLKEGNSYPVSREKTVEKLFGEEYSKIIKTPNNLLGLEYINAINKINPKINVRTIARQGAEHDSDVSSNDIASASFIRGENLEAVKDFVPPKAYEVFCEEIKNNNAPCRVSNLDKIFLYRIKMMDINEIAHIKGVVEGLENRIKSASENATSFDELVENITTKRYTKARVRRILFNCLLSIKNGDFEKDFEYIRVLGANQKGMEILKKAKSEDFFISPKFSQIFKKGFNTAFFENKATDIFVLSSPKIRTGGLEFYENTVILK